MRQGAGEVMAVVSLTCLMSEAAASSLASLSLEVSALT